MGVKSTLLDGIATFVEVVNSGSFTGAAQNMGHSTSYISKEISKLEERIGIRLLHRTTRTLSLTPEGKTYFQQCQQIVDDAVNAENAVSGVQGNPKGVLRVSCPVAFGVSRLQPFLAQYTSLYPNITLEIDLNDRKVDLITDAYDVVIRATLHLEDSSLVSRLVMRSQILTLASPDYLAKHGVPHHAEDLERHKVISYSNIKNPNQWVYYRESGKKVEVPVDGRVITNNSDLILALAVAGQGIVRLPKFNLTDEVETGKLIPILDQEMIQEVSIYMVYPSRKHMSAKVRSFIDFVVDKFGE